MPVDKAPPPFYFEQSLQQDFLRHIQELLFGRLKDVSLEHNGKSLRAEIELETSDVLVNGNTGSLVKIIVKMHAFRGQKKRLLSSYSLSHIAKLKLETIRSSNWAMKTVTCAEFDIPFRVISITKA
jgi:hypothetical protein